MVLLRKRVPLTLVHSCRAFLQACKGKTTTNNNYHNLSCTTQSLRNVSPDAIQRAQASVKEIEKLLLGSKLDRESLFHDDEIQIRTGMPLTNTRFDELNLCPLSVKALHEIFGYEKMTPVQASTLSLLLQGNDAVVKAKAGTGKTIAFLLPVIEAVREACPSTENIGSDIISVIVCPTRELALQIFTQARALLQFQTHLTVKVITGGFRVSRERSTLKACVCQILVATPGRLLDHLEKTDGFSQRLEKMKIFVLDEADHVLDMGFRKTVEAIIQYLPTFRQTLLFSATIPKEIRSISKIALLDGHRFIDMVDLGSSETHNQIKQQCIIVPVENQLALLYSTLKAHTKLEPNYKVLVFCITARITMMMHQIFKDFGFNCIEIHSKKSQMYRFHTFKDFRDAKGSIVMFTSDVSSRGLDYPDVTLVVQIGLPERAGTYINRIGRTGRCDKIGESVLILTPWEEFFVEKIKNQSIEVVPSPSIDLSIKEMVLSKISSIDPIIRWHAYRTWLGYYLSLTNLSLSKEKIVSYSNEFSTSIGFVEPPVLPKSLISKMSLRGVKGLTRKKRKRV